MSFELPEEVNPFEAPLAGIGDDAFYQDLADHDAELIRLEHIGHEANIKSIGHLYYVAAFLCGLGMLVMLVMLLGGLPMNQNRGNDLDPTMQKVFAGFGTLFYLVLASVFGALGFGLAHLHVWARWTAVVLISIGLLVVAGYAMLFGALLSPMVGLGIFAIGDGFNGLFLYLLLARKSWVVFSPEYKEVIRKTPNVRAKTSLLAKIVLVGFIAVVVLLIMLAMRGT